MREIAIVPLREFEVPLEAENIQPDLFATLSLKEIRDLEVWEGNRRRVISDLFSVAGDDGAGECLIRLDGDFSRVKRIGEGMREGEILVRGDVGMRAGSGMRGGSVQIEGDAGDWLGREMRGGSISVKGNAGNYVGSRYWGEKCGMRGGEIKIEGSAGAYLGDHICGGRIKVKGDAGDFPGASNRGGVITIGGDAHLPGAEMVSGAIVVKGRARVLPSYGFQETAEIEGQLLWKFVGDLVEKGNGELYVALVEDDGQLDK